MFTAGTKIETKNEAALFAIHKIRSWEINLPAAVSCVLSEGFIPDYLYRTLHAASRRKTE